MDAQVSLHFMLTALAPSFVAHFFAGSRVRLAYQLDSRKSAAKMKFVTPVKSCNRLLCTLNFRRHSCAASTGLTKAMKKSSHSCFLYHQPIVVKAQVVRAVGQV
ncbi:hypothetical protein [Candidatus Thiosymbion oneisti]|uniref:hypothetical protein n=1 Tax=Candidatus Thiosymbion oneisti TaxID=589554 RepID=UPI00105ECAAC|nr:hypothetical protein [Candidatus Thiosymbion oneisti]